MNKLMQVWTYFEHFELKFALSLENLRRQNTCCGLIECFEWIDVHQIESGRFYSREPNQKVRVIVTIHINQSKQRERERETPKTTKEVKSKERDTVCASEQ